MKIKVKVLTSTTSNKHHLILDGKPRTNCGVDPVRSASWLFLTDPGVLHEKDCCRRCFDHRPFVWNTTLEPLGYMVRP